MILPSPQARAVVARIFDLFTFRAGAFLIWLTCAFIPLGQHRLWLRVGGWWMYPIAAFLGLTAISLAGPNIHNHLLARLSCIPYGVLMTSDLLLIVVFAEIPVSKGSKA